MRFAFTDEQIDFRDAVRDLLTRECTPAVVRAAWENEDGRSGAVWDLLAEMGVLSVLVPESEGGLGMTMVDVVLLLEECGRVALPEPIVEHAVVAAPLLSGPRTVTTLIGGAPHALAADSADVIVAEADGHLWSIPADDCGLVALESVDRSRHLAEVTWSTEDAAELAGGDAVGAAFDRGALGTAAVLLGLGHRMLGMTVEYATDRRQFGAPIGSFQAVKHQLADARTALEFARPLVARAAYSIAVGDPEASVHVSMAKAHASDAAELAGRAALQCHGAIGYSYEYDLHLWMKRAWALAAAWGDARWHRARVAAAIL
ncbi:MAG: acyl-CoA dehydrogenase family protein [Actinomycetes bacterium]